jgi:epoxyqueuosine reductase
MDFQEQQKSAPDSGTKIRPGELRRWTDEEGFAAAGLVALPYAAAPLDGERFARWIEEGRAASMDYLRRANELGELLRRKVETPFPWARSVLVCWTPYAAAGPRSIDPAPEDRGWIARYAWSSRIDPQRGVQPSDYHKVLLKRLRRLETRLLATHPDATLRSFVDTGPVVERSLAIAAGLGWRGKNTCLIHPQLGSYGFLAVMLTSLAVEEAQTHSMPDRCGSCTRCIEACPTGALDQPYRMDAARCIAYLTIEHKGAIADALKQPMGRQLFGCDICQEVCPWNRKAPFANDAEMQPRTELINPALDQLAELDEAAFERLFNGSPIRRTGFDGLRRNLAIAMGNSGLKKFLPVLDAWCEAAEAGLQDAARWARQRLERSRKQGNEGTREQGTEPVSSGRFGNTGGGLKTK